MSDQKTEKPTKKRLLKAREEGTVPSARQFIAGVQFCIFVALLDSKGVGWLTQSVQAFREQLKRAFDADINLSEVLHLGSGLAYSCFLPMVTLGASFVLVGLAIQFGATKFGFAPGKLAPDPKRLNPLNRIKSLPKQNLTAALQSAVLLPIFAAAIWAVVSAHAEMFMVLPLASVCMGLFTITTEMQGLVVEGRGSFSFYSAALNFCAKPSGTVAN